MGDAALAIVRERLRPKPSTAPTCSSARRARWSPPWTCWKPKACPADRFAIGEIAVAVQLAYLDVRKVIDWRAGGPTWPPGSRPFPRRESMTVTSVQLP
jgi:glutathione S-transferase